MRVLVRLVVGTLALLVIAALFLPIGPSTRRNVRMICVSNLKQASIAQLIYQGDNDERFPPRDAWMDATYPYTKRWEVFRCPLAPKGAWGYAFNGALSFAKAPKRPEAVPLLYESVNPMRNASDLVASLPAKPRHRRNVMSFADGHAKAVQ